MGYKTGKNHCFRNRCHVILLKSEGRTSKEAGKITSMSNVSVNSWAHKYKEEGIEGLFNKSGQGRKPLLSQEEGALLIKIFKSNRQRLQAVKAKWELLIGINSIYFLFLSWRIYDIEEANSCNILDNSYLCLRFI
jgi:transposase